MGRDTFRRLWRAEGLRVRPRKAHKPRTAPRLERLVKASAPGQVWAIDFQFDSDWKGRVFNVCNLIDEFTRQHLALRVVRCMGAVDVIGMLDLAALARGAPRVLKGSITGLNSSPQPWGGGPASTTHSKHFSHRANPGITGSWNPYTTACVMNCWKITCSRGSTTPAPSSPPGRTATMKSTPTARWAGSHLTSTRANGHNTTNNDQQLSKHLVRNTGPGHSTTSTTKTSSTRRNPLPNRPTFSYKPLWRLLIDRNMLRSQLQNLRTESCKHCQARTRWEQHHRCSSSICKAPNCDIANVCEVVPNNEEIAQ